MQQSLSFENMTVTNSNEEVFADFMIRDLWLSEEGALGRENRRVFLAFFQFDKYKYFFIGNSYALYHVARPWRATLSTIHGGVCQKDS